MSKCKRLVSLFLVFVILLGTFSSVFADNVFYEQNEITNSDKVKRLVERGYITGYGDGSLGLNRDITRAEFTAIVTRALGLEDVAMSVGNTPTGFKDVNASAWYNPYIAMASSKGIIKGYPDGTFKPDANVKYQEAITMMVRMVLNHQEMSIVEASGKYPMNYYAKASQLKLLDGIRLADINTPAERGNIFVILYNAIKYLEDKDSVDVEALILEKHDDTAKAAILRNTNSLKEGDILNLKLNKNNGEGMKVGEIYNVKLSPKDELLSFSTSSNAKTITTKATKDKDDLRIDNKRYDSSNLIAVIYNNKNTTFKSLPREINYTKAVIYRGKLVYLEGYNFEEVLPVESVKNNRIYGITNNGSIKSLSVSKDADIFLFENGNMTEIKLSEIEEGDIVHIQKDRRDTKIIVTKEKIEGKISKYDGKNNTLSIDSKEYNVVKGKNPTILAQGRRYFALNDSTRLNALENNKVKVSLNISGDIQFIKTDKDISVYIKAIVEEIDRDRIVVLTENDYRDYFYVTDYTELITSRRNSRDDRYNRYDRYNIERIMSQIEEGDVVKLLVDGRGDIEEIEVLSGEEVTISYMDDYVAEINKRDYDLVDDIVIFESFNGRYYIVDLYDLVDDFYRNRDFEINAIVFESGREIEAIVVKSVDKDSKKELVNLVNTAKTSISMAEKYKQNAKISKAILDLNKVLTEIEKNIDKFNNKEIETNKEKIKGLVDALNKEVLAEILIQIEKKLELVKNGKELYNEKAYEEIVKYIEDTRTNKEIKDYLLKIQEAEKLLSDFEGKVFSNIDELKKGKNTLEQLLEEERKDIAKVLDRAIYNEEAVDKYDFFISGLISELVNIQDIKTLKIWEVELENRKNEYLRDRFNLIDRAENEIKVYKLEELLDVANALLEGSKENKSNERAALENQVKNTNTFISKVKKATPDKIDIEELSKLRESLSMAIIEVAAKININIENAPMRLKNRIAEAEEVKQLLLQKGKIEDVFQLNNIILSIKAKIYAGKISENEIAEMLTQIEKFLDNVDIGEENKTEENGENELEAMNEDVQEPNYFEDNVELEEELEVEEDNEVFEDF